VTTAHTDRRGRPSLPADRYGAPRRWTRPVVVGLTVLVAGAALTWVVWAGLHHSRPDVAARLRTFDVVDERAVTATIDVERRPGAAAVCLLEAQAADHLVVGERQVRIPPGPQESLSRTYRIRTERLATNAVLDGCVSPE
jgi:Domain of unknown function (DUF4307)